MEEVIDFDKWLANYTPPQINFVATFDPLTGSVIGVGPDYAFSNEKHMIPLDKEIAEQIMLGKINLGSCFVDLNSGIFEIAEVKTAFKIDDVLHRIISKEWSEIEKPDIYITYNASKKTLKFELSEELSGTKKLDKKFQPVTPRKIIWDGETVMNFLITEYNDPNVLYSMLSLKISDLIGNSKTIRNLELPLKFSVYTRRVFKNYIIEHK